MRNWQRNIALFILGVALTLVLSAAGASRINPLHQTVLSSDEHRAVQAHILTSAMVVPESLSESFEPLEPQKRAKPQARFALLKEIVSTTLASSRHVLPRYFMAPSRAPPLTGLA
ncbi:hypothetical protein [Shewanella sp.]|uniref:hypothetical protein n=1 Tax=Shewanella sp. TaxID=50422 RepID=UPI003A97B64F